MGNVTDKATTDEVHVLHGLLCKAFLAKLQKTPEDITASDLNVIRQFLKDNGIRSVPTSENVLNDLCDDLPYDGENANILFVPKIAPSGG